MRSPCYYDRRRFHSGVRISTDADYGFAEAEGLCDACSAEAAFTSLISRPATSTPPLEILQAVAALCPRCGGSKERAAQPASVC